MEENNGQQEESSLDKEQEAVEDRVEQTEEKVETNVTKDRKKEKSGWKYELFDLAKTFVICFIVIFIVTKFFIKPVQVDGKSMYPTLDDNDLGFMNIISKKMSGINRFDVVIVYNENYHEDWVKRVIGLPGDSVYAKDDVVYVNGKPIEEPYLDNDHANAVRNRGDYFTQDFEEVILKNDEYFLMGDNRMNSTDSRVVGPFKEEDIVGKDVYVFYPFNHMRVVGNGEK